MMDLALKTRRQKIQIGKCVILSGHHCGGSLLGHCGGGFVVSVLAFYSDDPSPNPAKEFSF